MNIAHLVGYISLNCGGPPFSIYNLAKALREKKVNADIWSVISDKERKEMFFNDVNIKLFNLEFPKRWRKSSKLYSALKKDILNYDILHLHQVWDYPIYVGAKLACKYRKPYIISPRGIFMDRWRYNSIKKILYFKIIFGKYMDRATCIHALSDLELKGLLKAGIKGIFTVIPNGIRVEDYQNLPKNYAEKIWPDIDKSLVCLYMGRLSPEKGIELLITSWAEVIKQHKEAKLLIAGEGTIKYKEKLRNQIKKLGLESYVLFIGLLDDFKKKVALGRADVYVQASYSEGMSNSILEAMVSGKPCVITKGCNFPSIAEWAAGEVVEPDPISMSQAILRILSLSQRERIDMGQKGKYEVINNFSWEKIALKYYKVYECILNNETIPLKP